MSVALQEVAQLLYREARLMDEHRYDEWFALWDDPLLYWVPSNKDDPDPTREVSIIYADRPQLEFRIERLKSGAAWSQDPPSRLCRSVSNIELDPEPVDDGLLCVHSVFQLSELRHHRQRSITGRVQHHLRQNGSGLRIAYKKVALLDNDEVIDNLTFLI